MLRLPGSVRVNLILVVLAGALPVLAVVLGSGWERHETAIENAARSILGLADFHARGQEAETARVQDILGALAREPAVLSLDAAACDHLLRNVLTANPGYARFGLIAPDGAVLAAAPPLSRPDLLESKAMRGILAAEEFAAGYDVTDKEGDEPILFFGSPVRDVSGRLRATLVAALRSRDLSAVFEPAKLPTGSFVGLADSRGALLSRYPPQDASLKSPMEPNVWRTAQSMGTSGTFSETGNDGTPRLYAVRRLFSGTGQASLTMIVAVPEQEIVSRADAVTRRNLLWVGASLFLSTGLAWLAGKRGIHDRVVRMVQVAQLLGRGELSARSGLTETRGSLGQLARAMDNMAQALESDRAALVCASEARDLEIKRRAALMDVIGDGVVVIDKEHRVVEANRSFARMLGYSLEETIGLRTWDYVVEMNEAEIRTNFASPSQVRGVFESFHRRKDGAVFPVEVNAAGSDVFGEPLILAVVRDVGERKKAERALRESEDRYRTLFTTSLDAITIQEGLPPRFTLVNPSFTALTGHAAAELYAMEPEAVWSLVHPDDREMVRHNVLRGLSGQEEVSRVTFRIQRKDGEHRWVDVIGRRLRFSERPMNISFYRDVTEEQRTRELLARAKEQAEAANRAKSDFLANMSHEIRTPLNGVLGMLQLLRGAELGEEQAGYADMAIQACKRLTRLLSDILDLSRVEAGKLAIINAPFDVFDVIRQVEDLFRPLFKQSAVSLHVDIDPGVPRVLRGDAARLQQILTNLVGNSIKFTAQGSVSIAVHRLPTQDRGLCRLLFSVADTGAGIGDDAIGGLFQPFTQASAGFTRTHQGAGLGLAICKRLVALMGGSLAVDSELGAGTTVYLSLCFEQGRKAPHPAEPEAPSARPEPRRLKILAAEDDRITQTMLRVLFAKSGHEAVLVDDGKQAVERLAAEDFDLVLMDAQMPVMDGVEATRIIREGGAGPGKRNIPIIAMTAYAMAGDREFLLQSGVDDYLAKPVELEALLAAIAATASGREGERQANEAP